MFWTRFLLLCEIHNTKPNPVGKEIGISSGILTKWKKDGSMPGGELLIKIADYFDCSIDFLVGRSDYINSHKNEISESDLALLKKLHCLSEADKNELLFLADYKIKNTPRGDSWQKH